MSIVFRREALFLFVGDLFFLTVALWGTLLLRYSAFPELSIFISHLVPFFFLFLLSTLIFFSAGLYNKHTVLFKSKLPETVLYAQVANVIVGAVFFSLVPYFGIQPKTNLLIYLALSTLLVASWRLYLFPLFRVQRPLPALLIGDGEDIEELAAEINANPRYTIKFVATVSPNSRTIGEDVHQAFMESKAQVIVWDTTRYRLDELFPDWYKKALKGVQFIDAGKLYEDVFDRVSLTLIDYRLLLEQATRAEAVMYGMLKRIMDFVLSLFLGALLVLLFPLLGFLIKRETKGPVFARQTRIGKGGKPVVTYKFRTMERVEDGVWIGETPNKVTRVGSVLRFASLDELPQVLNVFTGDFSLIGPRSDVEGLRLRLEKDIPYYNIRYMVTPGISGWAQVMQGYARKSISPQSIEESRLRLAYDLYYLKHRSFLLDIAIVLRTGAALLSRFSKLIRP